MKKLALLVACLGIACLSAGAARATTPDECNALIKRAGLVPDRLPTGNVTLNGQTVPIFPNESGLRVCERYDTLSAQTRALNATLQARNKDLDKARKDAAHYRALAEDQNYYQRHYVLGWLIAYGLTVWFISILTSPLYRVIISYRRPSGGSYGSALDRRG